MRKRLPTCMDNMLGHFRWYRHENKSIYRVVFRVVFDGDYSYIEHKATGIKSKIEHDEGTYALWVWIMVPEQDGPDYEKTRLRVGKPQTGRFQGLMEEDEEDDITFDSSPVFTRLV